MSYSSRRHIIHHDKYGTLHRLEVQQKDYAGSSTSIKATSSAFDFEHDEFLTSSDSLLKVYENTIQKGTLDIYPLIENSTDFALLQDIFESDEDEFRLVWKIDGTPFFTSSVINDLLEYPELSYPFQATISAKDFSRLEGEDYPLTSGRVSIIKAIAELLGYLGYDLNIETATSWTENGITEGTDFLQQIYIDRYALRTYARTGDETDETITVFEALEHILNDNCLILKQLNGVFKIDQISAYKDPTNVLVTVYDSAGDEVSSSTIDTTLDASSEGIIVKGNSSKTKGYPAIRQARVKFDHRTSVSGIQLPTNVELTSETPYTQYFISNGNQVLNLSGTADARMPSGTTRASARMFMRLERPGGFYYWNSSEREWQTDSIAITKPLTRGHVGVDYVGFHGPFSVTTEPTPADAGGELRITIAEVTGDNGPPVTDTTYSGLNFSIRNSVAEGNSTYIDFQLTQTGGFSSSYKHKDTFFGDGPIGYARSALSRSDESLTAGAWGRRGDATLDKDFHENILKEIVDVQRTFINKLTAALYGIYDPTKILVYRSKNFFYTGGRFNGKEGDWTITLMRVNIQTSTTDTYIDLPKFHAEESTGARPPEGGEGSEGMTPSDGDARWFQRINLLSEVSASNISTLLDNINLGTTDDVQFGNIRGTTLRTDTGKFLAPTDFAFRNAGDTDYRNVAMGDLSANEGNFSGVINQTHRPTSTGGNIRLRTSDTAGSWGIGYLSTGEDERLVIRNFHESGNPIVAAFNGINLGVGVFTPDEQLHVDAFIRADSGYKIASTTVINSNTDSFFRNGEYSGTLDVEGVADFYDTIGSPDYVPRLTGWQGDNIGHFDFRRVYSDEIITRTFISETTLSLAGTDYLTRSNATLSEDITFDNTPTQIARTWEDGTSMEWEDGTPMLWETYPTQDLTVDEHSQLPGAAVFGHGDYVLLRATDRSSGLRTLNVWGRVFNPGEELNTGLVGMWRFDEGSGDVGYNFYGNNADHSGASYTDGVYRSAILLEDGAYSTVADYEDIRLTNDFEISFWASFGPVPSGTQTYFEKGEGGSDTSYTFDYNSGNLRFFGYNSGGTVTTLSTSYSNVENKTVHVSLIKSSTSGQRIIITDEDGVVISDVSNGFTDDYVVNTGDFKFGRRGTGSGFNGSVVIDEFRIYKRTLSTSERDNLINTPSGILVFNGDGTQTYDFQILKPTPPEITTPITLRAGSVIIDYGQSGDGVIERSAILDDSPYDRIFTWEDKPWLNENYDIKTVRGNLGTVGEPDVYGAYFKDVVIIDGEGMRIGMNADGNGNFGIYQDEDNYWLPGVGAKFTAGSGAVTVDNIISSINASTEGIAIAGNRISIDGDTVFSSDVDIRGTLNGVDGTFSGTLSGVDGTFEGNVEVHGILTNENEDYELSSVGFEINLNGSGVRFFDGSTLSSEIRGNIVPDTVQWSTSVNRNLELNSGIDLNLYAVDYVNIGSSEGVVNIQSNAIFSTGSTEWMRVTSSGIGPQRFVRENVGLGGGTQTLDINRNTRTVMCSNNIGTTTITDIVFSSGSPEPTEEITIVNLSPSNSINFNGSGFRVSATLLGGRHMKLVRGGDGFWYPQTDNT